MTSTVTRESTVDDADGPQLVRLSAAAAAGRTGRRVPQWVKRLAGPALLVVIWTVAAASGLLTERSLAGPGDVVAAFAELWRTGEIQDGVLASLGRVAAGLAAGVGTGLVLAAVAGLFVWGEHLIDSSMNTLRTIPVIALVPLTIVWFGLGETAKVFVVALGVVFPIYLNTFAAIRNVDVKFVEAARSFGLSRWGVVRRVLIPASVPGFLIGLRWSLGTAWLLLIFAETINATSGLGYLLNQAGTWMRTDMIMLLLIVYGLLGLTGDAVVRLLERWLLSWRRGFGGI